MIFSPPIKPVHVNQPFGVNYTNIPDFYTKLGLKAHDGMDFSLPQGIGSLCYAVADGIAYQEGSNDAPGYGLNVRLRTTPVGGKGYEIVYGHLLSVITTGPVKAGDVLAKCDNTGYSTGPHLHLGVRAIHYNPDGSGPYVDDYNNGYFGYMDPAQFFPQGFFDLQVDKQYGNQNPPSVLAFAPAFLYFLQTQKRLPTKREYNALRYGYWDLRTVLDPAMYVIWANHSKPEAVKLELVK